MQPLPGAKQPQILLRRQPGVGIDSLEKVTEAINGPVAEQSAEAGQAVHRSCFVRQQEMSLFIDHAAAGNDRPAEQEGGKLAADADEGRQPQHREKRQRQRSGQHAGRDRKNRLEPRGSCRRFRRQFFDAASEEQPRQPFGPRQQPLRRQVNHRRGQSVTGDADIDQPQHEPREESQRQEKNQGRPPNRESPPGDHCCLIIFLRSIDVARGVAIVFDQSHAAAKGSVRGFREQFVLRPLPGEQLPRRATFGRRAFDQPAAQRGALRLEPDGTTGGVKHALLHVPRAGAWNLCSQGCDQIAIDFVTIRSQHARHVRSQQRVFRLQPDEALKDVRLIRHREALPCREDRFRVRAGCQCECRPVPRPAPADRVAGEQAGQLSR